MSHDVINNDETCIYCLGPIEEFDFVDQSQIFNEVCVLC